MPWNLLGHEWAARILQQHIARGQTRHAYLFSGQDGVGRRTLALRFAAALNCTAPGAETGVPCGECRECRQFEAMQHPDLSIVELQVVEEVTRTKILVEQIRDLQHSLSLSPYQARYRIALLLNFQMASPATQNALLKTLEDTPEKVVLLLVVDAPEALLPTVGSRCEILRLRPMPLDDLQAELEKDGTSPAEARLLAHLSGGRVGLAKQMKTDPNLVEQRGIWIQDVIELLG